MDFLGLADLAGNADLFNLAYNIPKVIKNSISANTHKTYASGFKKWTAWCSKFNFKVFPVEIKCLLLFISD